jgi:nicotinate dehydrogenase subunit A
MELSFHVNGAPQRLALDDASTPLLYVLRDELGLNNPHFGCGLAQCGACTVLRDGTPIRSCVYPAAATQGAHITTLEGLGTPVAPHPVQAAMIAEQAFFCGYCLNGWVMTAVALLQAHPRPSEAQIVEAFGDLKCRCGSHMAILRAVRRAAAAA